MSDDLAPPAAHHRGRSAIAIVVVLALAVGAGVWWYRAHRTGIHFAGMFTAAVGVYPGSDVRILGVQVGAIDSVTPEGALVRVDMHLNPGVNATAGTDAVIISPNLVSDRYVQLTGVYSTGAKLTSGTIIPSSRTKTPVELDTLYNSLISLTDALGPNGANKNGALSRVLNVGAANLKGNGADINATIDQVSQATQTLDGSKSNIFGTITNLGRFTQMLKTNNDSLVTVNQDLASVTATFAADRQTFGEALKELGQALGLVQTFIQHNRAALSANVTRLGRVAQTLAKEKAALTKTLLAVPLLVQNFIAAYDSKNKVLRGRADLNELTIWAKEVAAAGQSASDRPLTSGASTAGASVSGATGTSSGSSPMSGLLPATNAVAGK